ncbi:hypothetical protein RR46_02155 [Papilio xuthus]|uniref:Uncharacterized protein n=1 Tax=Papilio xuthus TaxID=66420 RepID=A0A194QJH2_PAPXU|nr:hypothetical protein RR46_02155 [Papilio xuthus]
MEYAVARHVLAPSACQKLPVPFSASLVTLHSIKYSPRPPAPWHWHIPPSSKHIAMLGETGRDRSITSPTHPEEEPPMGLKVARAVSVVKSRANYRIIYLFESTRRAAAAAATAMAGRASIDFRRSNQSKATDFKIAPTQRAAGCKLRATCKSASWRERDAGEAVTGSPGSPRTLPQHPPPGRRPAPHVGHSTGGEVRKGEERRGGLASRRRRVGTRAGRFLRRRLLCNRSDTQGRSARREGGGESGDGSERGAQKTSSENPPGSHNHSYYRMARKVFMRERFGGEWLGAAGEAAGARECFLRSPASHHIGIQDGRGFIHRMATGIKKIQFTSSRSPRQYSDVLSQTLRNDDIYLTSDCKMYGMVATNVSATVSVCECAAS